MIVVLWAVLGVSLCGWLLASLAEMRRMDDAVTRILDDADGE